MRSVGNLSLLVLVLQRINLMAMKAKHTGAIILGGGVVKHHILNANLMRNGADHAVFINTGNEFDGSDRCHPDPPLKAFPGHVDPPSSSSAFPYSCICATAVRGLTRPSAGASCA